MRPLATASNPYRRQLFREQADAGHQPEETDRRDQRCVSQSYPGPGNTAAQHRRSHVSIQGESVANTSRLE